jgi:hypothetical protein
MSKYSPSPSITSGCGTSSYCHQERCVSHTRPHRTQPSVDTTTPNTVFTRVCDCRCYDLHYPELKQTRGVHIQLSCCTLSTDHRFKCHSYLTSMRLTMWIGVTNKQGLHWMIAFIYNLLESRLITVD